MSGGSLPGHRAIHDVVVDSALDAIILMDAEGRVVEFNPAAERMFGYSRDEATGRLLADPGLRTAVKRYLDGEREAIADEARWLAEALPYRSSESE